MKKLVLFALSAFLMAQVSCSKSSGSDDDEEEEEQMVWIGNITFYITQTPGCENVQVFLSTEDGTKGWEGSIAKTNLTTTLPATCGMTSGFTFKNIKYGKYKFNTNCNTRHLNGTITLDKECYIVSLD